jgi:tyrosyl-tRNA synthetase
MEEVEEFGQLKGAEIRKAKEVLAFEATRIIHGDAEAEKARVASKALFISVSDNLSMEGSVTATVNEDDSMPTTFIEKSKFVKGIPAFKLFETSSLCTSGSEARRLIEQGGAYINGKRIEKFDLLVTLQDFNEKTSILLRTGKKKFHRIKILDKNQK